MSLDYIALLLARQYVRYQFDAAQPPRERAPLKPTAVPRWRYRLADALRQDNNQAQQAEREHDSPTKDWNQSDSETRGNHAADRYTTEHDCVRQILPTAGCVLDGQRACSRHDAAKTQA